MPSLTLEEQIYPTLLQMFFDQEVARPLIAGSCLTHPMPKPKHAQQARSLHSPSATDVSLKGHGSTQAPAEGGLQPTLG